MKSWKYCPIIGLFLALCLCLTGCAARTAVTEESFTAVMEELGYPEQEADTQSAAVGLETYRAYTVSNTGVAIYRLYSDTAAARSNYASMVASMKDQDVEKTKEVDSATYNRVEYAGSGAKLVIIRTDGMLLTINGAKSDVEQILDKLGL